MELEAGTRTRRKDTQECKPLDSYNRDLHSQTQITHMHTEVAPATDDNGCPPTLGFSWRLDVTAPDIGQPGTTSGPLSAGSFSVAFGALRCPPSR